MGLQFHLLELARRTRDVGFHVEPERVGSSLQQFASASSLDVVTRRCQHQNRSHLFSHCRQDHRYQHRRGVENYAKELCIKNSEIGVNVIYRFWDFSRPCIFANYSSNLVPLRVLCRGRLCE
jgi:hypothetical protein